MPTLPEGHDPFNRYDGFTQKRRRLIVAAEKDKQMRTDDMKGGGTADSDAVSAYDLVGA